MNLQNRQSKIQDKRKTTERRDFVMEICSWFPFTLYRNNGITTPYNSSINRIAGVVLPSKFEQQRNDILINRDTDLFTTMRNALVNTQLAGNKVIGQNENSDFSYIILGAKNSYLSIVVVDSQDVLYTYSSFFSSNVFQSILVQNSQEVFSSRIVSNSHKIFYSSNVDKSNELRFCANMIGCSECISCDGLTNQSYCINNKQHSKEEYFHTKQVILLDKETYNHHHDQTLDHKGANIGDDLSGSFNKIYDHVENGLMNYQLHQGRNTIFCNGTDQLEYAMDCCSIGGTKSDNIYASMGVGFDCHHIYCSAECSPQCSNVYYSYLLDTCSFCLGCIGLKNKSYCILNKQYTKEEWYIKVDEIFGQMEQDGTLGQFFPASMNPFYFNDTAAYLIGSSPRSTAGQGFTKEEVVAKGYLWRDDPIKVDIPEGAEVVKTSELDQYEGWIVGTQFVASADTKSTQTDGENSVLTNPHPDPFLKGEGVRHIDPLILKKIIQDPQGNIYRIVPMEYEFLMKHGLPLPRKHRLDRMKENFRIN